MLIQRGGPQAVTLRGAARLAGVSQTAPYRHFKDKRALLAALAAEGFRQFDQALAAAAAPFFDDPARRLHALGAAYVGFAVAHPANFRVMFGPELGDKADFTTLLKAGQGAFGHLVDAVRACRDATLLRDAPIEELTLTAWSMIHGLSNLLLDGQLNALGLSDVPTEELAQRISGHAMRGLLA